MDSLSKPELLTLLSIMEGELEARDLVIETLRVSRTAHPSLSVSCSVCLSLACTCLSQITVKILGVNV